jgi:hypothetical protein
MERFILLLFWILPCIAVAQSKPSELYWLYYTPDSCAYMEREFKYGGYQDSFTYSNNVIWRAHMTDEQRADYDRRCIERAKTLVFYTEEELKRYPVKLKPGDEYNRARRNRR